MSVLSQAVWKRRWMGLGLAIVIFVLDQLVKWSMIGPLALREKRQIEVLPFFDLTWAENYGVSLGLFRADSMEQQMMLIGVTGLIAVIVFVWMLREKNGWDIAALSLILGGALGNIRDRVNYGYVVDYADLHIGSFRPFLIFNLADVAITFGVIIILARSFFFSDKDPMKDPSLLDAKDDTGESAPEKTA
ncbi:signal peptidase II [Pseudoblastomonas halimionae]|uniref:Lipoprotein signal peptidase n=1 Tax=Alteriqipengyuania halimionae TaxID=1926630 RepID=A0A6I4U7S0_9SPHN|nr:signal peptidase II [Alteriqipengyuania halimionae]MXP10953.1 signal peptidase II [Alteriqipengyuania halimionae]